MHDLCFAFRQVSQLALHPRLSAYAMAICVAVLRCTLAVPAGVGLPHTAYFICSGSLRDAVVYVQAGPCQLPARLAVYWGSFEDVFGAATDRRLAGWRDYSVEYVVTKVFPRSEVFWFYIGAGGGVECYVRPWPRPAPGVFIVYAVDDIDYPSRWWLASVFRYDRICVRSDWGCDVGADLCFEEVYLLPPPPLRVAAGAMR